MLGLRVALSLALVLVILWFVARQLNGRAGATRRVPITVLGRQSLGRRSGMAVVEVGGRLLLVGVSETGVQLITELDDDGTRLPSDDDPAAGEVATPYGPATGEVTTPYGPGGAGPVGAPRFRSTGRPTPPDGLRAAGGLVPGTRTPGSHAPATPPAPARSFADLLASEEVPRHRARRRIAPPASSSSPLAGSMLDKATWTRTWAALQQRTTR